LGGLVASRVEGVQAPSVYFLKQKVYKVFILSITMAYKDPKYQKFMTKCYQKALSILKLKHPIEFKKILKGLLKGGKDGKNKD